jgi:hypothetical protein
LVRGGSNTLTKKESLSTLVKETIMRLSFTKDGQAITGAELEANVQESVEALASKVGSVASDSWIVTRAIGRGIYNGLSSSFDTENARLRAKIKELES